MTQNKNKTMNANKVTYKEKVLKIGTYTVVRNRP